VLQECYDEVASMLSLCRSLILVYEGVPWCWVGGGWLEDVSGWSGENAKKREKSGVEGLRGEHIVGAAE
jgi:hypothetical protein